MSVSVRCNATDCVYHRNGMCDKMEITVSEGPMVKCMDYEPNRGQMPMGGQGPGAAVSPALLAQIFQGRGAPSAGPAGPPIPRGLGY